MWPLFRNLPFIGASVLCGLFLEICLLLVVSVGVLAPFAPFIGVSVLAPLAMTG